MKVILITIGIILFLILLTIVVPYRTTQEECFNDLTSCSNRQLKVVKKDYVDFANSLV